MDPIAHTFTGAVLASAGLRRATPLATAALLIGANAPDVDVLASLGGDYASLAFRRGWTHGILAIALWPFVVTGLLLAWERWIMRRQGEREPSRPATLLAVAAIGVMSHPTLDWLNNYGLRWLMPFDGRWFYGDALFIIDPWVWLMLGGAAFLMHAPRGGWLIAWSTFWLLATALVFFSELVPAAARAVWAAGLAAVIAAHVLRFTGSARPVALERFSRCALAAVAIYMSVMLLANLPARAAVRAALEELGAGPVKAVMVGPVAANPFRRKVIAETANAYYVGRWRWPGNPRLEIEDEPVPRVTHDPAVSRKVLDTAVAMPDARRFLSWSRFPVFEIETSDAGHVVRLSDLRYGRDIPGPALLVEDEGPSIRQLER